MIKIHSPEVIQQDDQIVLRALIEEEHRKCHLWFSVDEKYGRYLCAERADAFVVALLTYAMHHQQDIQVLGAPVTERLSHNLSKSLIPALKQAFPEYKRTDILCDTAQEITENASAVGTGLSCGVDSLSTICEYTREDCPVNHRLTHLAFFNVGAHGDFGGEKEKLLFAARRRNIQKVAKRIGLPLVVVDSNVSELIQMNFLQFSTFRSMSAVLALKRLFGTYYYASSHSLSDFRMNPRDNSFYDVYTLSMLSTKNLTLLSSDATLNRIDKIERLAGFPLAREVLNVCVSTERNCGVCHKCLRTLVALDVIGKSHLFERVFDMDYFHRNRHKYVALVLSGKRRDQYYKEIYDLMCARDYQILPLAWLYALFYKWLYRNKS